MPSLKHSLVLIALLPMAAVAAAAAEPGGAIEGQLVDKQSGAAVEGATVLLDGIEPVVVTDVAGKFRHEAVAAGVHELVAQDTAHETFRTAVTVESGKTMQLRFALDPSGAAEEEEVVISAERFEAAVSDTVLQIDEVRKIPGTQGDVMKIVQSLPGVARGTSITGTGGPGIVVRGASPEDSDVRVDDHGIPLMYHFGGLKSTLNSDMLQRIDFMPGGFGAEFGNVIGGVVDVKTRPCNRKQLDGYVELSMLDAGFFVEGPILPDLGFTAAARRSTVDAWLPYVLPEITGVDMTVTPVYWDYQLKLEWSPTPKHRLYLLTFGSQDEMRFLIERPVSADPSMRGTFAMRVAFYRGNFYWLFSPSSELQLRVSASLGYDNARIDVGGLYADFEVPNLNARADLEWQPLPWLKWRAGLAAGAGWYRVGMRMPQMPKEGEVPTSFGASPVDEGHEAVDFSDASLYLSAGLSPIDRLVVNLGLRYDYADRPLFEWSLTPRLSAKFRLRPGTMLKAGAGLYTQGAQEDELSAISGNPDLGLERAWHFTLGLEQEIMRATGLDLTAFYKLLDHLVVRDDLARYSNAGKGEIMGLEVLLKRDLTENLFGWLAYTLMSSQRRDHPGEAWRRFDFDQTHILTLVLGARLPTGEAEPTHGMRDGWELGLRFQLTSGNPQTPILGGIYDADNDNYLPLPGPINSERLPLFHQLDLRVDYTWAYTAWALTLFLDVQNVYDHRSIEGVEYNYDYTERAYFTGLPIIPYLGLKGSF